jgi:hypothetical protein
VLVEKKKKKNNALFAVMKTGCYRRVHYTENKKKRNFRMQWKTWLTN